MIHFSHFYNFIQGEQHCGGRNRRSRSCVTLWARFRPRNFTTVLSNNSAQFGVVVAQLIKATVFHQTATQQFPVRSRHPPQSPEGRQESCLCMINKSRDVRRPFPREKKKKIIIIIQLGTQRSAM
jgi:hypothetical protein